MKAAWFTNPILKKEKRKRSYYFLFPIGLGVVVICFSLFILNLEGYLGGRISTEVREEKDATTICPSGFCYETYVWYNGDIVEAWFDDLPKATDSVKRLRNQQAKDILHKAKYRP